MRDEEKKTVSLDILAEKHNVTAAGRRLLGVVVRPEARTMKMVDICKMADISQDSYYRLYRDTRFQTAYSEACRAMLLSYAAPASQALGELARSGDPNTIAAIKMVLELSGLYQNTATVNVVQDDTPTLKDILDKRKKG